MRNLLNEYAELAISNYNNRFPCEEQQILLEDGSTIEFDASEEYGEGHYHMVIVPGGSTSPLDRRWSNVIFTSFEHYDKAQQRKIYHIFRVQ